MPVKPPYIRYYGDQAEGPKYLRRAESELYRTVEFAERSGTNVYARKAIISDEPLVIVRTRIHADFQAVEIQVGPIGPLTPEEPVLPTRERVRREVVAAQPYYSGFTYRAQILDTNAVDPTDPNFGDQSGWTMSSFIPTQECLKSFGANLSPGYQNVKRLSVNPFDAVWQPLYGRNDAVPSTPPATDESDNYLKDPLGEGNVDFLHTHHNSLRPCSYTGKMAEVVSLLLGYGRWNYDDFQLVDPSRESDLLSNGLRIQYNARFVRTHGVIVSTEGNLWIVEISQRLGIVAWPMTYLTIPPFPTSKYYNYPIESFGGYPDGYCVPYNVAEVDALIASGDVIQLMSATDYQNDFYTDADSYTDTTNWAFNPDGTEARVTCMREKEFGGFANQLCHEYWKLDLSINDSGPGPATGTAVLTELESAPLYWPVYTNANDAGDHTTFTNTTGTRGTQFFYGHQTNGTIRNSLSIQGSPLKNQALTGAEVTTMKSIYSGNKARATVWVAWVDDHWEEVEYVLHDDGNGGLGGLFYEQADYPLWPIDFAGVGSWDRPTGPPYRVQQEFFPGIAKGIPFLQQDWGLDVAAFIQSESTSWTPPAFASTPPVDPNFPVGALRTDTFNSENIQQSLTPGTLAVGTSIPGGSDTQFYRAQAYVSWRGTVRGVLGGRGVVYRSDDTYLNYRELSIFVAAPYNRSAIFAFKIRADVRNPQEFDYAQSRVDGPTAAGIREFVLGSGYEGRSVQDWAGVTNHPVVTVNISETSVYPNVTSTTNRPRAEFNFGGGPNPPGANPSRSFTDVGGGYWNQITFGLSRKQVTYLNANGPPGSWGPPAASDLDTDGFTPKDYIEAGGFVYDISVGPTSTTESYSRLQDVVQFGSVTTIDASAYDPSPWARAGLLPAADGSRASQLYTSDITVNISVDQPSQTDTRTAFNGDLGTDIPKIEVEAVLIAHRLPSGPVLPLWSYTASGPAFLSDPLAWAWSCAFEGDVDIRDMEEQPQQALFPTAQVAMWGDKAAIVSDLDDRYFVYSDTSIPETYSWGADVIGPTPAPISTGDGRSLRLLTFIGYNEA